MSVMVVIRFPIPHSKVAAWASHNMDYLTPIVDLMGKHKRISHRAATSETEFVDFDEWPSAAAYAAFRTEAGPYIDKFEDALGVRSTEQIYEMVE